VHLWAAAEAFRRFGSAFRSEGWKVLEELGVEGDGKLAKLASWARRRLHLDDGWLGAPLLATAAYIASLCHEKNIYMRG